MSTPQERLRALRWGADMLQQMTSDPSVPVDLIERADQIASVYPIPEAIVGHVREGGKPFPQDWISAFLAAWLLFENLRRACRGSEKTRVDLRYTQRHYPEPSDLEIMGRQAPAFPWLPGPGDPLE